MIGERIRELRGKETQVQWEARFGVTRDTIRRYESGVNPPNADFLTALCEAYNVDANWLLLGKGERKPNGGPINQLEDPLIRDIKLWLRDMTSEYPSFRAWFETELLQKIPQFNEWRKKNQPGDSNQNSAAG